MQLSVIIPVYNAAIFLEEAVTSALGQEETVEVILVEDSSADDSLSVCRRLEEAHKRVKLYRHPDGQNHGAGATRNLGLSKAGCEFVSFLDADDYYLPDRFAAAKEVFERFPDSDGVFGAMAVRFTSELARQKFLAYGAEPELITMHAAAPPEDLFPQMLKGQNGFFHHTTLVIRKAVLELRGIRFDESMEIAQDVDFVYQLAARCKLRSSAPGVPVLIRRFHENNRVFDQEKEYFYRIYLYEKWFRNMEKSHFGSEVNRLLFRFHLDHHVLIRNHRYPALKRILFKTLLSLWLLLKNPKLIAKLLRNSSPKGQ